MIIKYIKINNFRCFENCTVTFDDHLTVLVGPNNSGKSAVLDALSFLLVSIMQAMDHNKSYYLPKGLNLINLYINEENEIIQISYNLINNDNNNIVSSIAYKCQLDLHDKKLFFVPENKDTDSPRLLFEQIFAVSQAINVICVFYSSKRTPAGGFNFTGSNISSPYAGAFSPAADFASSLKWFDTADAAEARKRITPGNFDFRSPELTAVRTAISRALGAGGQEFDSPHMENMPAELFIENKTEGKKYKAEQLSGGYKTMLALVMDLAWRMVMANQKSGFKKAEDYLSSPAIVLIDEIELHLHPSWQQTVLPSLMSIFPGTQFIVTTHSPQVLTSVKSHHIRQLQDGQAFEIAGNTYGGCSSDVMEEVMNVRSRPNNVVSKTIDAYLDLINKGLGRSEEARKMRTELEELIPSDPFLAKADLYTDRFERRRKNMKKKDS
jgi:predicted ATP-binding protein involved in virulence